MTKEEILAAAGYPNTPDGIAAFYNEYDTPDAFFAKHGGSLSGAPHNGQPTADQFFNYGSHVNDKLNIPMSNPFFLKQGGTYYGGPTRPYQLGGYKSDFPEGLYNYALKQREELLKGDPKLWSEDPDMLLPTGELNYCIDCMGNEDVYKNPQNVKDIVRLIEEGYSTGTHYFKPQFEAALKELNIENPVFGSKSNKSTANKRYGGYLKQGGTYYNGDVTEFCWGGGLPGGPNEMPEMLHGGYHSPMNYGSFPAVEWGGALDASNEDVYPMMDDGGSNLAKIIKAASKKMKKTYAAGGKTTIQGGNQNYLENKRASFDDAIKNNVYNAFIKEEEKVAMQALNPYATGMEDMDQTYQAKKGKQKEPDDVPVDFAKTLPDLFPTGRDYSKYLPADIQSQYMMSNADYAKMADLNQRLKDKTFNLTNFEGTPEWGAMARLLGKTGRKWFGPKSVTYKFTGRGIKQVPVKDTELNLPGFEKQRQQGTTPSQLMNDYYNQGSTEFEDTAGMSTSKLPEEKIPQYKYRNLNLPAAYNEDGYGTEYEDRANLSDQYIQKQSALPTDDNSLMESARGYYSPFAEFFTPSGYGPGYADENVQLDPSKLRTSTDTATARKMQQLIKNKKYGGGLGKYQMAGQVTPEQYYELEKMYKAAQAANVANPGKMSEATGAFQQRYHELYPERAQEIIQSRGQATTKGKNLAPGQQFSLESNVDKYFGPTTEKYWQSIQQPPGAMAQPGSVTGTYPQLQDMNVPDTGMNLNFKSPASTPNLAASTKPSTLGTGANLQGPNEPDTNIGNLNLASAQGVKPTKDEILAKKAGMDMKPLQKGLDLDGKGATELKGPTDTEVGPEETIESKVKRKTKGIGKAIGQYAPGAANWLASNLEKKPELDPMQNQPIVLGNRGDYRDAEGMGEFRPDQQVPVQFPGGYGAYRTKFGGALPQALSGLEIKMQPGLYGTNGNRQFSLPTQVDSQRFSQQPTEVRNSLTAVPRDQANLEAEGGETALVNIDGIPAHFKISGKRHSQGGVPLDLPDNSFIYSDTASMKIKDPNILAQFGMAPKKGGYTPAEIAKKYDINKYRKILSDANSEDLERKTAEAMIANNNMKLAKLAMAQESIKGFPQGIPVVAMPYMIANDIDPTMYAPTQAQEEQPDADMGVQRYGGNIISQFRSMKYGGLPMAQAGASADPYGEREWAREYQNVKKQINKSKEEEAYNLQKEEAYNLQKAMDEVKYKKKQLLENLKDINSNIIKYEKTSLASNLDQNHKLSLLSDKNATIEKLKKIDVLLKDMITPGKVVTSENYKNAGLGKNPFYKTFAIPGATPENFKNNPQLQNQIMQGMGAVDPYTFKPVKYPMMPTPIPGGERMFAEEIPVEEDVVVEQTTKPATKNVEVKKKPEVKTQTKSKSSSFLDDYKDYL